MHMYMNIGGLHLPSYGLLITFGLLSANLIAIALIKKYKLDLMDFIILEAYSFLGGFLGAKLLYFWVSRSLIEWNKILNLRYFNQLMQSGFVFYGGLIGGIIFVLIAKKIHQIDAMLYVRKVIFLLPWIHCFGRIGCFMAGCCYGKPYGGHCSVIFPEGSLAPSGIPLFPVQLIEAICLMVIAIVILVLVLKKDLYYSIEIYIISYSVVRFVLEYFRYDAARGEFLCFSTSQWISILLFIGATISILVHHKKIKDN